MGVAVSDENSVGAAGDVPPGPANAEAGAGEPLDAVDHEALRRLALLFTRADAPPAGFVERMRFAVAARGLDDELARLTEPTPVAARGQDRTAQTWTFESASLTILVTAEPTRDGGMRVDGWLAPAAERTVRLRLTDGGEREVVADELGRFGYADVPGGLVQIVVLAADDGPGVVTPTFEL